MLDETSHQSKIVYLEDSGLRCVGCLVGDLHGTASFVLGSYVAGRIVKHRAHGKHPHIFTTTAIHKRIRFYSSQGTG